ncbi:MAG: hypothetical protein A2W90_09980 [Bacteroidetes bacterium GWF2_42_66]|nr:MAG: hypothetical protein A2W92_05020 [Bacteroidetes bacterium GWA2_42_15]OFX97510.1 MAG: hypothetical protein A2W89_01425 [Bacteroidetes bacterium GWE2_42_39]OFY43796.1 MAG: hypothetical protein A2W90_09980 [Bacteroidetes bacterium GWF2_42_66]HBL76224.1 hypothetical protein [Prolixibacteraceae bacterium]HCR89278.1 hypothetical protein [Prolixibacteraceae bacterium]
MKRIILLSLILVFAATVNAQTSDKKWAIGTGLGAYGTTEKSGAGFVPELYLSRYLSPRLDLMLKGDLGLFNTKLKSNIDWGGPTLNLRYKFLNEMKTFRPYIYGGPGYLYDNSESGLNFDLGFGAKYYFSPNTALYFDAAYIYGIEVVRAGQNVTDNILKATVGLEFGFGKVKDSDMDGVSDKKDKCPDTPAAVAVDADGCPIDTDGDGVADYVDDCPTVAGLSIHKGCPDTDKDGIADKNDACPDIAGPASLKGCPDTDGDGVADKDDKCPDTPKGWKVDTSGCPLDQDKDGIVDQEDDCPTVAGPKGNKGCPVKEPAATETAIEILPIQVDPVYFDTDKANYKMGEISKIDQLVKLLKKNSDYKVKITGYADNEGTNEYNMILSQSRIDSVVKVILKSGIEINRISSQKAMGETMPEATNNTLEGRAMNRRVEFEIFKTK